MANNTSVKKYQYEKNNMIVLTLTMMANVVNYIFQILMGNMMSIEEYGILNTLLSFYVVLSMATNLFQTLTARYTAVYNAQGKQEKVKAFLFKILKIGGFCAFFIWCIGKIVSPFIAKILGITNQGYISYIFYIGIASIFAMIFWGALQGLEKFISYSLSNDCVSIIKLIMAVTLLQMGMGLNGVLVSLIVSTLVAVVWGICSLKQYWQCRTVELKLDKAQGFIAETFIIQSIIAFLTNCDMLFIKAYIVDGDIAGLYAAGITLGKIPFYIATALTAVMLPAVVQAHVKGLDTKIYLYKALTYSMGITIVYFVGLKVFGKFIVGILYGDRYIDMLEFIIPIGFFVIIIIGLTVMMNYFIACADTRYFSLTIIVAGIAVIIGIYIKHKTVNDILYTMSFILGVAFLINMAKAMKGKQI